MKKLILFAFIISTNGILAQNTNVQSEVTTTVRTIKDSDGEKKVVKNEVTKEIQKIEVGDEKANSKDMEVVDTPVQVIKSTEVINPDGSRRTVHIDRSATYESEGKTLKLELDAQGYKLIGKEGKPSQLLRKTSTNAYFYVIKDKTTIAYFDTTGNLVLEWYDSKTDSVTNSIFKKVQ